MSKFFNLFLMLLALDMPGATFGDGTEAANVFGIGC